MGEESNPLKQLSKLGQSVWLDYIRRDLITSGELERLIREDSLAGMTSNPAIFGKAISEGKDYEEEIRKLSDQGSDANAIYERLSQKDVQDAADVFRSVYDRTSGIDGYVSLEVNPHLAQDTEGTIEEARRLWAALKRPNVMIKIPGTRPGLPAIRELISEGINVNVTLLFSVPRYKDVVDAWLSGLESRARAGKPVDRVASVASFFVSRIDTLIDPMLEKKEGARGLQGEIAIANAKIAYQHFKQMLRGARWKVLAAAGAMPQRLLWASTSSKNPAFSDVKYVEALIGSDTVNTIPVETLEAYRDHGKPQPRIEENIKDATRKLDDLSRTGIDLEKIATQLEAEGAEKFEKPFDKMLEQLSGVAAR